MIDLERLQVALIACWVILAHIAATSCSSNQSNEPLGKIKQNYLKKHNDSDIPNLSRSSSCNRTSSNRSYEIPLPLYATAKYPTAVEGALLRNVLGSKIDSSAVARNLQANLVPCVKRPRRLPSKAKGSSNPLERLLHITVCGGLQQQRQGIVNAVVLAKLLNATLVVPELKVHHHWKDKSQFEDIFNLQHFTNTLHADVPIMTKLPSHNEYKAWRASSEVRLPRSRVDVQWYLENALPVLQRTGKLVLRFFHWHLPENLPHELQAKYWTSPTQAFTYPKRIIFMPSQLLRCRVQFHALMFVPSVMSMAAKAIELLHSSGPYIAVHLRYEIDWIVHKGCLYDNQTNRQLAEWASRKVAYNPSKEDSERKWREGLCPLSPRDVGFILKALGVGSSVRIFLAGGTPFDEQRSMKPLRDMFPGQLATKQDLLTAEDMRQLAGRANLLTAVDYMVCLHSDFMLMTVGGNMGRLLRGHRFYRGGLKETYFPTVPMLTTVLNDDTTNLSLLSERIFGDRLQQALRPTNDTRRVKFFDKPWECVCKKDGSLI